MLYIKLNFEATEQKTKTNNKNKRKRNLIWYNPPLCSSVKKYRQRINKFSKKYFNKNSPLSKIFNKHNKRISYSCMGNLERLIKSHNQRILNKSNLFKSQCNCASGCKYDFKRAQ